MAEDATSAKETPKAEDAANDDAAVKPEEPFVEAPISFRT